MDGISSGPNSVRMCLRMRSPLVEAVESFHRRRLKGRKLSRIQYDDPSTFLQPRHGGGGEPVPNAFTDCVRYRFGKVLDRIIDDENVGGFSGDPATHAGRPVPAEMADYLEKSGA